MTSYELRNKFLEFFRSKGHAVIPSAPLVPANDPTVLFTTAGMHPLVPYLLGEKHPVGKRLVSVQKCVRTQDIDEVGDNRHDTFFEMLGNWSLGDYFKKEAIEWSWEFLTDADVGLGMDPKNLYVSVFAGDEDAPKDEESVRLWQAQFKKAGIDAKEGERIFSYGKEKNWWGPAGATGPCGPDTEMFINTGKEHNPAFGAVCHPNCDCGRFIEIWNDVFMEYNKTAEGKFETLTQKNVDTGMGLERVAMILQNVETIFDTDLFQAPFGPILSLPSADGRSSRIVADHMRTSVFMFADGVRPSNKDRGYVLRRLIRRLLVHWKKLAANSSGLQLTDFIRTTVEFYGPVYPELRQFREEIIKEFEAEVKKFENTLEKGLKEFERLGHIDGKTAFNLYQSYGFPWEITRELLEQRGSIIDRADFEAEFKKHQELSRTSSAGVFKGGLADHTEEVIRLHTATHLMNKALRMVLGEHVWQKGSHITRERTRFDFTHPKKMTPEQIAKVEELVNGWIARDLQVKKEIMPLTDARKLNAIGAFGEKYGETVSVYTVFDPKTGEVVSREFCGGPHVEHTGIIGKFKIAKEEAIAAGIRRIRAAVS